MDIVQFLITTGQEASNLKFLYVYDNEISKISYEGISPITKARIFLQNFNTLSSIYLLSLDGTTFNLVYLKRSVI